MKTAFSNPSHFVRLFAALVLVFGALALSTSSASAATIWTVTKTADTNDGTCDSDCSLREAIAVAVTGDTIVFDSALAGQTLTPTSYFFIDKPLTIDGSSLTSHVTISGNNTIQIFYAFASGSITFKGLDIINGYAASTGVGGGIYVGHSGITLNVDDVTFSGNRTPTPGGKGGAIYIAGSSMIVNITNSTFQDNGKGPGNTNGGAIYNQSGTLNVSSSTFSGNSVGYSPAGGAIYNDGTAVITNSTFFGNVSNGSSGAAIYNNGGLYITNSTLSGNTGVGAFYNANYAQVRNSIFANTVSGPDCIGNAFGINIANLIESRSGCSAPMIPVDPQLGALADNGGPTNTMSLMTGSPAINTGNDAACAASIGASAYGAGGLDQRGVPRPQGDHCDLGAYEVQTVLLAVPGGETSGLCQSWAQACELSYALTSTVSGQEIWVAAGTYKPTAGTDRTVTFQLKDGVALYGGFAGTETLRSERDPATNVTILSGDLNGDDAGFSNNAENSFHVISGATGATLDGFTITAGNANAGFVPNNSGAGMYNYYSDPVLTNLIFSGNSGVFGAGMYNYYSDPTLTGVVFSGNTATSSGGGMDNSYSDPALTDVTFSGNTATNSGGGMLNSYSSPSLMKVTFSNNTATTGGGGGMYNNSSSHPVLTNLTFSGNTAGYGGGISNNSSSPTLTNVTFSTNSAGSGGGMYNASSNPQIRNTILWGNTASSGAQIYDSSSTPVVSDSVVQGGYAGGTNILTGDPLLGTLDDYGGFTRTLPLQAGSSAIDTGNDSVCPGTDQRGASRPQGTQCDIGAYESQTILLAVPGGETSGLCQSWAQACELRYALTSAVSGQEIWAAAGTYLPTAGTDRTATFQLKDGVAVYGGFDGTESAREERDPAAHITILSGDLNGNDVGFTNNAENSYHVVIGATGATLDGFTITGGNANAGTSPNNYGGGMYNASSSPVVADVTFSSNSATYNGGGIYNSSSSPAMTNVTFIGNRAITFSGGGMYNTSSSSPALTYVTFSNNLAPYGGGMSNYSSSPTLTNVVFSGNTANYGGGMNNNTGSNPTLTNVTFSGNTAAAYYGGGISNVNVSNPVLTNVTFSNNSAVTNGGGMFISSDCSPTLTNVTFDTNTADFGGGIYNSTSINLQIRNTIFWGNTASTGGAHIYNSSSTPVVSDSVVQGGCPTGSTCTNILTDDPLLGTIGDFGGLTQTIPLLPGSSAIDAGNPTYCTAGSDQRGVSYVGACDIGAFESQGFTLTKTGGDNQTTEINTAFTDPLALTVTSAFSEPVGGGLVTFTAPASGASTNPITYTGTIASGAVSQAVTANGFNGGPYNVTASAGGAPSVNFTLTNVHLVAGIRYSKPIALGAGDCSSWEDACTLQTALISAISGDEIWAAAGTYLPTTGTDRTATFQLKDGVAVYGGFAGTESAREERDPATHVTILSGDLNGDDVGFTNNAENSYHVVTGATGAILDGFTITSGNANATTSPNKFGGGMYNYQSSPTLANVTFSANSATSYGGGMYNYQSSPTLANVTFSANSATSYGGGMYNYSGGSTLTNVTFSGNSATSGGGMYNWLSSPTLTDVIFSGNTANYGGGMSNSSSSPTLTNVTFSGNTSAYYGGGMSNINTSNPVLTNVTFSDNSAVTNGGGMSNSSSCSPTLTNVTFSSNSANSSGGGMYNASSNSQIRNTIFWGNTASTGGAQIYNSSSTPVVSDSVVQGGCPTGSTCTNILTDDPLLGTIGDFGGLTQTIPLLPGSSAIDAGNATYCTAGSDQRGVSYVGACDIGAFESQGFTLAKTGGDNQTTGISTAFADPLALTVASAFSEPVDGGLVTFTAPASGASTNPITYTGTIASGAVSQAVTANGTIGGPYTVTASAAGGTSVNFTLVNTHLVAGIRHAKPVAAGTGDCSTWEDACTLQTALISAISGDEIWVAAGTYLPTTGTDRTATFQLLDGVAIYGGFAGTETLRSERDPAANLTILSGDLNGDDSGFTNNAENAYHVVTGATGAILDGFTITAGNANATYPNNLGGGMYNSSSSPTLANMTFSANSATNRGGGMYNTNSSNPTLTDATFSANSAGYGGGLFNFQSSPTLANVTFSANSATYDGGGMYNYYGSPTLTLNGVTFSANSATSGGGMCNANSIPTLTNVTFSGNTAASGGGMYNISSSSPTLTNTIIANSANGGDCVNSSSTLNAASSHNLIEDNASACGLTDGANGNIIGQDPALGALADNGGFTQTHALLAGSPAIDAGTNTGCPAADQRGIPRPQGEHCDIGAYEAEVYTLTVTTTHGTVAKNPDQITYHEGDEVQLTATPSAGWSFANWTGDLTGTANPGSVTIHGNTSVTANYTQDEYTLTVTSDHGTVTKSPDQPTYHYGDVVQLIAAPEAGWNFVDWTGDLSSTDNPVSVTIQGNTSVTANYNQGPTDITLSNNSVNENQPIGTTVGTFTTTDAESGDTHTYSFCGGADDASFAIVGDALNTLAVFDYETKNAYNICIRTDDGNGGTFDKAFAITVVNVNEILTATFRSVGTYDGWILESTETSNKGGTLNKTATTFNLGDGAADKQYRAILSFNTINLPDNAVITKVTLKIRKQGLVGTDPFTILGGLKVDMRKPFFGTTAGLVISDFQAAAGKSAVATFGKIPVSNWYSALLNATGRAYVNKTGTTQFRLRFVKDDNDDNGADYMKFFSGNHTTASVRPTLIIEYYTP